MLANLIAVDIWGRCLALLRMQKNDIILAPLVICPVCPVTVGTEPKIRPGPSRPRPV